METKLEQVLPQEIEARSFEIITEELGSRKLDEKYAPIVKRVIHTTADFEYVDNLVFSPNVLEHALEALKNKACIVTDTKMAKAMYMQMQCKNLGWKHIILYRTRMWCSRQRLLGVHGLQQVWIRRRH